MSCNKTVWLSKASSVEITLEPPQYQSTASSKKIEISPWVPLVPQSCREQGILAPKTKQLGYEASQQNLYSRPLS